ncbi:hypothetical protein [Methylobacterium sp. WL6]|uniref:hypothetical protein n=1 Tax=Methylobacterium sp. WL6 TaxID=2603901 RepID=UPI00164F4DE9|nr:hypothetical protein [Methylobacterium sp. WL6]
MIDIVRPDGRQSTTNGFGTSCARLIQILLAWRYSSIADYPFSRPMPLRLHEASTSAAARISDLRTRPSTYGRPDVSAPEDRAILYLECRIDMA